MFLSKVEIKEKVKSIILDDIDNDIVFIVANKGIGKLALLGEIYDVNVFNKDIIIANGKRIHCAGSSLKKAYIDGILLYLERNNVGKLFERVTFRNSLIQSFAKMGVKTNRTHIPFAFFYKRKLDINQIIVWLSDPNISIITLKTIYMTLAGNMPLIILAEAMKFTDDDKKYLLDIVSDTIGARVTYIVASRATGNDIQYIHTVLEKKEKGVWVFPLLPDIVKPAELKMYSMAEISLSGIGETGYYEEFVRKMLSYTEYYDLYSGVRSLISEKLESQYVFFLANQEISIYNYVYLQKIINTIYHKKSEIDDRFILPYEGKFLWLDALSYYIVLHDGMDKAIETAQTFFFDILNNIENLSHKKSEKNKLKSFLKETQKESYNYLSEGFPTYFSSLSVLVNSFVSGGEYEYISREHDVIMMDILDKVMIRFSESSIGALKLIYEYTQLCGILDIGLEAFTYYFETVTESIKLTETTVNAIKEFLEICMECVCKWNDITLLEKIIDFHVAMGRSGHMIRGNYNKLGLDGKENFVIEYLEKKAVEKGIRVKDIMVKNTIFLSYNHADEKTADMVETQLSQRGYTVVRDVRDVKEWDDLDEFMKSIRKQDYVVILISDKYLHSQNCIYEIYQLLKDENYVERTFPIVLPFTEEEKEERERNNQSTSIFETEYWADILVFWTNYLKRLDEKLASIPREYTSELNGKYRDIGNMVQSLMQLFDQIIKKKLLGSIETKHSKKNIRELVDKIDIIIGQQSN